MEQLISKYEQKNRLRKIYGIQITMVNGDKIYTDANDWGTLEGDKIVSVKEYKHNVDDSFTYDSSTYVNPKYILYARPMMMALYHDTEDVNNAEL